jgi:disulfide bond formation protein DsbB
MTAAAQAFLVVMLCAWLIQLATGGRRRAFDAIASLIERDALRLAWLVATVGTLGSLWMSEVEKFLPCQLCWYQRIALYPLAVILLVALIRNDRQVWRYVVPLALIGAAVSGYHVQLELFPDQATTCSATVPCTTIWFKELGYITIPVMAGTALLTTALLSLIGGRHGQGITK